MSEDAVRNATVIADEDTDLLVVSRELFNRSMKVYYLWRTYNWHYFMFI